MTIEIKEIKLKVTIFLFVLLIGCGNNNINNSGKSAGIEYCNCLKRNQKLGQDSARSLCRTIVMEKYRLYKMYVESRDTFASDLYFKSTIDSMVGFAADFANAVDSCHPPYWFKE
jgi:hypothetical protein